MVGAEQRHQFVGGLCCRRPATHAVDKTLATGRGSPTGKVLRLLLFSHFMHLLNDAMRVTEDTSPGYFSGAGKVLPAFRVQQM